MNIEVFKDWCETRTNTHSATNWSYERDFRLRSGLVVDFVSGYIHRPDSKTYVDLDACIVDWNMAEQAAVNLLIAKREVLALIGEAKVNLVIIVPKESKQFDIKEYMGIEVWCLPKPDQIVPRRLKHLDSEIAAKIRCRTYTPIEEKVIDLERKLAVSQRNTNILLDRVDEIEKRRAKQNADKSGFVYLIRETTGYYKIGHTRKPEDRRKTFNVKLPFLVEYEHLISCNNRIEAEKQLHERYAAVRIPGTEWFQLTPEQVEEIKAIKRM